MKTRTEVDALFKKARRTNAERDQIDSQHGFAAPGDRGVEDHVRTAMMAIEAGCITEDRNAVAEGYAMLEKCVEGVKKKKAS